MQELGEKITRWRNRNRLHHLPDIAAMGCPVADEVKEYFFARHLAGVAIGKAKGDCLGKLRIAHASDVAFQSSIGLGGGELQFVQCGRGIGVGGAKAVRLAPQVRKKNPVYHVDVIQSANRVVQRGGVLRGIECGERVEQLVVRPRLLRVERLE